MSIKLHVENPSSSEIVAMVTGRVVVLKFWNDQSQFQVACPQGVHKHLVCLVRYSVVGNLERRDDDVMHRINNDVTT